MEFFSFTILFILLVSLSAHYIRKDHNNFIQPHALYTVNVFLLLFLVPFIQFYFSDLFPDKRGILFTNFMIGLSYLSFSMGFFAGKIRAAAVLNRFIKKLNIENVPKVTMNLHLMIMVLTAMFLFICLAEKSGFGLSSWLLSPRTGYQNYRRGLGHLYVISMAILNVVYLYTLFFKVNSGKKLIAAAVIFIFAFYFYGCKGPIIFAAFEAVVFYNFFIRKITLNRSIIAFGVLVLLFILFFSLYRPPDTSTPLSTGILSYAGYYDEGRKFFADFKDNFEYAYGKEYLDSLWTYVPRAFYPQKPYSYGAVKYIVEHYYPDAGARGSTPAFGGPVEEFLNFGVPGVILIGFIKGYISALFYVYFLRYRNFVGFVLLSNEMGFSIFPIMHWPAYAALWYVINITLLLFHKQIIVGAAAAGPKPQPCRR